jgi:uncharacterized damage-inducible protein DinB
MNQNETADHYIARILGNVGAEDPWQVLATTAGRLRELTQGRSREELARSPGATRWSVVQILAHLADAEVVAGWRLRSILASNGVPIQAFDQDRWAEAFKYEQADPAESLDVFDVNRRANLSLLRRVDPALHAHHGLHAERGEETITHLVRLYAGHDLNHLRQVEALCKPGVRS